jgi:hypothetical protein
MINKWITATAIAIVTVVVSGVASAEEKDVGPSAAQASSELRPIKNAVELTIGTGYEQGFGKFGSGQPSLTDVGQAGGAIQVGAGYRIIPQLTLGLYGSGAMFGHGGEGDPSADLYSVAAGFQADWHILPGGHRLDPWISLGSGWRGYWVHANSGNTSIQGMEIAKLQVGLDYRITQGLSVSPVIGADLSSFFAESTPETGRFTNLKNPDVSTFLFAGMMGRFDIPTGFRSSSQLATR